jgi:acyl-[acyl-carrier-protein]-phospholipid O-acyltransferase/long-chain-fatty-acid--[acyl-carrier-protein] ligase
METSYSEPQTYRFDKSFKALMLTQFLGAFNDNLFKLMVLLWATNRADAGISPELVAGLFVLPFLIFASYSGFSADRFSKTTIVRVVKIFELIAMIFGAVYFQMGSGLGLAAVVFLMGLHSAFFSPAKYGILPELLPEDALSRGNGYLEFFTFLAILLGSALAGPTLLLSEVHPSLPGLVTMGIALIGLGASFFVRKLPAADPHKRFSVNPFQGVFGTLKEIRSRRSLSLVQAAIVYFWMVGAIIQLEILRFSHAIMANPSVIETGIFVTALAFGVGLGSIFAGKVSAGKIELGLVPCGVFGMGVSALLLGAWHPEYFFTVSLETFTALLGIDASADVVQVRFCYVATFLLLVLGGSAGIYSVPLHAFFQRHSPPAARGRFLATNNFAVFGAMLLAFGILYVLTGILHLGTLTIFLILGLISLLVTVLVTYHLPEMLVRCVNWLITHSLYSLKVVGSRNIPVSGGALLVCNHVSFADPCLLLAATERPIRFLMYRPIYEAWPIHWAAKIMGAIPVMGGGKRSEIQESLTIARNALEKGELVCIFAEGGISRLGALLPFKSGLERIVQGLDCPIIPVHLDQVWGSIFSFKDGKFLWKRPKTVPYPVTVSFGTPMPSSASAFEVRGKVQELGAEAFPFRKSYQAILHEKFYTSMRAHPLRACAADSTGLTLNRFQTFVAALGVAPVLKRATQAEMIGILLPPSVGALVVNVAVSLSGKIPVNLNYTAGQEALMSACQQCAIESVISSEKFLKKTGVILSTKILEVETLLAKYSRVRALLLTCFAVCLPYALARRVLSFPTIAPASLATVIFSSGSTAQPKGVMLSHRNISSNIDALCDLFQLKKEDCVVGILPFFHSFGFAITVWLPLVTGIRAVYHYNPVDAGALENLIRRHDATILLATPTFLSIFLRKWDPTKVKTLNRIVVGAEKLKSELAVAFAERFGVRPLEGYGCTELSPVAIISVPNFEAGKHSQHGSKESKTGLPLPGIAARTVDPETLQNCKAGEQGLLLIKGPNVMEGYLNNSEKTAEVIRDGWYHTGDIAQIDDDGFITITDRLSRFSKIGGEMVPHIKIEEEIQRSLGCVEQVCVVTAVPDDQRGERLIVLHTIDLDIPELLKKLQVAGLPNLWIPKREAFKRVDAFPLLGTGKLDLRGIKALGAIVTRASSPLPNSEAG